MVILLHGEESYLSLRELEKIKKRYKEKEHNLSFFSFDTEEGDTAEAVQSVLVSDSLFAEKKLVVVRHAFSRKEEQEEFLALVKTPLAKDKNAALVCYERAALSPPLLKKIGKDAEIYEFKKLSGKALEEWIAKEVLAAGGTIELGAIALLADRLGNDCARLKNEIEKLAAYDSRITSSTIRLFSEMTEEADIFAMLDSLGAGKRADAFRIFERLLKNGESEIKILAMLAFQVKSMLKVKSLAPGEREPAMHPYVFQKMSRIIHRFSIERLTAIYRALFDVDLRVKSGRGDPKALLTKILFMFAA